jgi:hypothetical protein
MLIKLKDKNVTFEMKRFETFNRIQIDIPITKEDVKLNFSMFFGSDNFPVVVQLFFWINDVGWPICEIHYDIINDEYVTFK